MITGGAVSKRIGGNMNKGFAEVVNVDEGAIELTVKPDNKVATVSMYVNGGFKAYTLTHMNKQEFSEFAAIVDRAKKELGIA